MSLPKQSLSSLNYKINNIENYLSNVDRDMGVLAEEEALWKQERKEWEEVGVKQVERVEKNVRAELGEIYKELQNRDQRCKEAVEGINFKIGTIREIQGQCKHLITKLNRRIGDLESILGGN